jgi:hypothetical protein
MILDEGKLLRIIFLVAAHLSTLAFVTNAYSARELLSFTSDITYSHDFKKQYDEYPEAIDRAIDHFAFDKLIGNGDFLTVNSLDQMNRIYIPRQYGEFNDQRLIMAKSGIEVTGAVKYGEIYDASAGYIVHFKTKKSGDVALFFRGFSLERIQKIKNEITGLLSSNFQAENKVNSKDEPSFAVKMNSFQGLFFPLAQAGYETGNSGSLCGNGFGAVPGKSMDAATLENLWTCAKGFGGGAWDSTGGAVATVVKGAAQANAFIINGTYQILVDPVGTFNRALDEFSKIPYLLSDIENSFGELTSALKALPLDIQAKIGCEIAGSMTTSALIAFLTSASGSPLFFRALTRALQKVAMALPKRAPITAKVAKLASGMEAKAAVAQGHLDLLKKIKDVKGLPKEIEDEMELLKPILTKGRGPSGDAFAKQTEDYEIAKRRYSQLKTQYKAAKSFLKNMGGYTLATKEQNAAIASYFAVSKCTNRASVSGTVNDAIHGQEGVH